MLYCSGQGPGLLAAQSFPSLKFSEIERSTILKNQLKAEVSAVLQGAKSSKGGLRFSHPAARNLQNLMAAIPSGISGTISLQGALQWPLPCFCHLDSTPVDPLPAKESPPTVEFPV